MSNVEKILKKEKIKYKIHVYSHDSRNVCFAQEAADKLGIDLERVFKTLIVEGEGELFVIIVSASNELDLKKFAKLVGVKKAKMGEKTLVEKSTGYVFGGISPIAQKKKSKTFIDIKSTKFETIFISAGNKGTELEIRVVDLLKVVNGKIVDISK